jgi:hypothetical protein
VGGSIPETDYGVRLRAFLAFDNVELYFIAFFERFVPVQLNRRIVNEYIRPVVASDESVALGVVEPLDLSLELSHWMCLSFLLRVDTVGIEGNPTVLVETPRLRERLEEEADSVMESQKVEHLPAFRCKPGLKLWKNQGLFIA